MVELQSLETDSVSVGSKKKGKKCRRTSTIWQFFDIVPNADLEDPEVWAKCKACGNKYKARSSFGTRNLRKHVQACLGANTRGIGQMLIASQLESLSVSDSKFDSKIKNWWLFRLLSMICPFHMLNMKV
jgi:hypothetical protein